MLVLGSKLIYSWIKPWWPSMAGHRLHGWYAQWDFIKMSTELTVAEYPCTFGGKLAHRFTNLHFVEVKCLAGLFDNPASKCSFLIQACRPRSVCVILSFHPSLAASSLSFNMSHIPPIWPIYTWYKMAYHSQALPQRGTCMLLSPLDIFWFRFNHPFMQVPCSFCILSPVFNLLESFL